METALSKLFVEINFYCLDVSGVTTKFRIKVPNNSRDILFGAKRLIEENNNFLFVRFHYMGSNYQVQNKNLKIIED